MSILQLAPIPLEHLPARPKVSVLVSNYNYAEYIGESLESALSQTYDNLEVIVCDDGSTDNSRDIIEGYCRRDARVRLIAKENGGQASGFNAAFAASTGQLICFLDSDDIFRPTKVACMIEAHQQTPKAGFGLHRVQRVSRQRRPQGVWPLGPVLPQGWHGERMLKTGGVLAYMPPTSGLSLHRSVADCIFPLPLSFRLNADQVITRLAPLLTSIVRRQEVLTEYRLHGANGYIRSTVSAESILSEIRTCRDLWNVQRDFLAAMDPDLIAQLQPLETSSYFIYLEYLHTRLSRSPAPWTSYQRFIADLRANEASRMWFWKCSIYLPAPVFCAVVNIMSSQSLLKEIAARLRGIT